MGESNFKKGTYNVIFGLFSQVITILIGLITPRLVLVNYGSEINGLLNSVSQVYTYMALLEAGLGTITLQALYKPIALKDRDSINAVLSAADKYYKKVGKIYIVGVFVLALGYPLVVDSTVDNLTIGLVVFFSGISSAVAFYYQAKYKLLLQAEGKSYVSTNINLSCHVIVSAAKVILILLGYNVLIVQFTYMIVNLVQILLLMIYIRIHYKWIDLNVPPNNKALEKKNSAFVHQITDMVFRNTDVMVLTLVPTCGLLVVSVYSMYNMLFGLILTAVNSLCSGIEFVLGQTFGVDRKRYLKLHDVYEVYSMAAIFALYTVAYIFILPFLKLYTSGVDDVNYIDDWLPLLFVLVQFFSVARRASAGVINYAQHFKETQNRAILEMVINLAVSIPCAYYFGVYGALLGTIAALLYRTNDMVIYANHKILNRCCLVTYKRWGINLIIFLIIAFARSKVNLYFSNYFSLIGWAIVIGIAVVVIFFVIDSILNISEYRNLKQMLMPKIKAGLNKKDKEKNL